MYTANTMASAIEVLGMSLPNSSAQAAVSPEKADDCRRAGAAVMKLIAMNLRPRDIMTRKAFENAIAVVMALGGSTNSVLHLLAMAHAAKVRLTLDDFTRIGKRTPVLADLKPGGKYVMNELVKIGGVTPLVKELLKAGLLHGDCMTVTGKTITQNLRGVKPYPKGQDVVRPPSDPKKKSGHLIILRGNLAEGGPGMREMLSPTSAVMGRGLGNDVALITDGYFSGGSHGFVVGHITPGAQEGGLLALVKDGDTIRVDADKQTLTLDISARETARRRNQWTPPEPRHTRGVLAKYAKLVSSSSEGAVTDKDLQQRPSPPWPSVQGNHIKPDLVPSLYNTRNAKHSEVLGPPWRGVARRAGGGMSWVPLRSPAQAGEGPGDVGPPRHDQTARHLSNTAILG